MPDPLSPAPTQETPFYERWWKSLSNKVDGSAGHITHQAGDLIEEHTGIKSKEVRGIMPWVAGAVALGTGAALIKPITKLGHTLTKGVRQLVTGFGYFEKIPLIGGAFTFLGNTVEAVGKAAGFLFAGAASILTFKAFSVSEPGAGEPHGLGDGNVGSGLAAGAALAAAPVGALAAAASTTSRSTPIVPIAPESMLRNSLLNTIGEPVTEAATRSQTRQLHELLGKGQVGERNLARITDGTELSKSRAQAMIEYLEAERASLRPGARTAVLGGPVRRLISINPFQHARTLREATGIGTGFGRVNRTTNVMWESHIGDAVDTLRTSYTETVTIERTAQTHFNDWMEFAERRGPAGRHGTPTELDVQRAAAIKANPELRSQIIREHAQNLAGRPSSTPSTGSSSSTPPSSSSTTQSTGASQSGSGQGAGSSQSNTSSAPKTPDVGRTINEQFHSESATPKPPTQATGPGRITRVAMGGMNTTMNAGGTALFGLAAWHSGKQAADYYQNDDYAGAAVSAGTSGAAATGTLMTARNTMSSLRGGSMVGGRAIPVLGGVIIAGDGINRAMHEETPEYRNQRLAQTGVDLAAYGTFLGGTAAAGGLGAGGTVGGTTLGGMAAAGGGAAVAAVAIPAAIVVGAGFSLWGIHECVERGIDISRIYDEIENGVKANTERFTHVKAFANKNYYLTRNLDSLKDAIRDEYGNVDLTRLENVEKLRAAFHEGQELAEQRVKDNRAATPVIGGWLRRYLAVGSSAAQQRYTEAQLDVRSFDAALVELDAMETYLQRAREATEYATQTAQEMAHNRTQDGQLIAPATPGLQTADRGTSAPAGPGQG